MTHKLYELLGVTKEASGDEVRKAYRKAAITHHPDKGGDPEKFKEIANAYQVLSDEQKRLQYDELGDEGFAASGGGSGMANDPFGAGINPHELFEQLFRGGGFGFDFGGFGDGHGHGHHRGPTKRKDHSHTINVSLADAYHGTHKTLRVGLKKPCGGCKAQCYTCQGRGSVTDMRRMGFMTQMMTRVCDGCQGAGVTSKGCGECGGRGHTMEEKKVDVKVAAGVQTGHRYVISGLGEQAAGDNEISGDLVIELFVQPDPNFQRQGQDLVYTAKLTLAESIVGKIITIPHFGGDIHVSLADYGIVQPHKSYIIPNKGMPPSGNLILLFQIDYNKKQQLTDTERDTLRKAFEACGM